MELSKYNCKFFLSWRDVCTWTNYEWKLLWKCWGLLYSWMRKIILCCYFTVLFCFCLFIQIVLHCESSVNLPLSVLLEKYCEALSARTNVTGIYFSISCWLPFSTCPCLRNIFSCWHKHNVSSLGFSLATTYSGVTWKEDFEFCTPEESFRWTNNDSPFS